MDTANRSIPASLRCKSSHTPKNTPITSIQNDVSIMIFRTNLCVCTRSKTDCSTLPPSNGKTGKRLPNPRTRFAVKNELRKAGADVWKCSSKATAPAATQFAAGPAIAIQAVFRPSPSAVSSCIHAPNGVTRRISILNPVFRAVSICAVSCKPRARIAQKTTCHGYRIK